MKKIWAHITAWMNPENITLGEISQSQKTNTIRVHFYEIPPVIKFTETERRVGMPGSWGGKHGTSFEFRKMKKFCL